MADIFLSYANEDREKARAVTGLLESSGWSVWWDRRVPAGRTWRSMIEEALRDMRCMVVLWSTHSVESDWVKEEAEEARALGKLIPVLIEPVKPPVGFRSIQAADLTHWDGSRDYVGARQLIADLEPLMGKQQQKFPEAEEKPRKNHPSPEHIVEETPTPKLKFIGVGAVSLLLVAGIVLAVLHHLQSTPKPPPVKVQPKITETPLVPITPPAVEPRPIQPPPAMVAKPSEKTGKESPLVKPSKTLATPPGAVASKRRPEVRSDPTVDASIPPSVAKAKEPPAVNARVLDHIRVAKFFRGRGEYGDARAELEKAKALEPQNKEVRVELENIQRACEAERKILGRLDLTC
jgi:hypothetical protein